MGTYTLARGSKSANIEVYTLTGITIALGLLSFAYDGWCQVLIFFCVPLSLFLLIRHKGLVVLDSSKGNRLPSIAPIPVLAAAVQVMQNKSVELVSYSRVWQISLFITIGLMIMLWFCSKYLNRKRGQYMLVAFVVSGAFAGNGYGLVVSTNCLLDKKDYEYYEPVVTAKSVSKGKRTSYYLTLEPWAHQPASERERVDRQLYDATQINDRVGIYYFKGGLNIPWYRIKAGNK